MTVKSIGIALVVIGLVGLAVSLLADVLGIGKDPNSIGQLQLLGAAIGLILAVAGGVLAARPNKGGQK